MFSPFRLCYILETIFARESEFLLQPTRCLDGNVGNEAREGKIN